MNIEQLTANITDLPGVEGLCLIDLAEARVLHRRMPSFIPESCYAEAVRRIIGLYETIDENFLPADDYSLRFEEKWLILRRTGGIILMIMAADTANLPAIRMVTNLTLKHLASTPNLVATLQASAPAPAPALIPVKSISPAAPIPPAAPVAPAPAQPAPAAAVASAEPARKKPVRFYRGAPIEE